ncbi:MAG: lipocalin-like domain-containing protein [Rhodospirillales bacterium]|nr:lipocalin-like domain-containing protein [Rhodospirillales bacterium]
MSQYPLIGTWKMVTWQAVNRQTGDATYPLGEEATGLITYTPDGYVFVEIMAAGRTHIPDAVLFEAPTVEAAATANSHIAYCGRFEVTGDGKLIHHIDISSFPNWPGTSHDRNFEFLEGDRMKLSAPQFQIRGEEFDSYNIWERI